MKKLNNITFLLKHKIYNYLLLKGNKTTCEKVLLKVNKFIQKTSNKDHKDLIKLAIINNSPVMQIKQIKRKRKKLKEFPIIVSDNIRIFLAIKLILKISNQKMTTNFSKKLKEEILLSAAHQSSSVKTTTTIQEQALKLKKYAHYRWVS